MESAVKKFISFFLIISLLSLSSCAKDKISAEELLSSLEKEIPSLSYGAVYLSGADEGTRQYMSYALFSVLYGDGSEALLHLIEEYAIYLSSFLVPSELAVFKCYSPSDAPKIEKMCLLRLSFLKKHFKGSEYASVVDSASIVRSGRFVIMAIAPDLPDVQAIVSGAVY